MNLNKNNDHEARTIEQGRWRVQKFYNSVESAVKSLSPEAFAIFASQQLQRAIKENRISQIRPHHTLHAIESYCAFARRHPRRIPEWSNLARIMNVYHEHKNPLQYAYLEKNEFSLFMLLMQREQMDVQYSYCLNDIARVWRLYALSNPLPRLNSAFEGQYGINFREWITMSVMCGVLCQEYRYFHIDEIAKSTVHSINRERIRSYFKESSRNVEEIGSEFKSSRKKLKNIAFHGVIRSQFLRYPLIRLHDDVFFAPKHDFLTLHAGSGIYSRIRQMKDFSDEFGTQFETYVATLAERTKPIRMLRDNELESHLPGKHCDLLLEFEDYILLVECKAVSFTAEMLTERSVLQDNSTTKIADAIVQIATTIQEIRKGSLNAIGINKSKPIESVIVTYGDVPFVNSDWHFEKIIAPSLQQRHREDIADALMIQVNRPIVLKTSSWENLVGLLAAQVTTMTDLKQRKKAENYITEGDWDVFLCKAMDSFDLEQKHPELEAATTDLTSTLA